MPCRVRHRDDDDAFESTVARRFRALQKIILIDKISLSLSLSLSLSHDIR